MTNILPLLAIKINLNGKLLLPTIIILCFLGFSDQTDNNLGILTNCKAAQHILSLKFEQFSNWKHSAFHEIIPIIGKPFPIIGTRFQLLETRFQQLKTRFHYVWIHLYFNEFSFRNISNSNGNVSNSNGNVY